MKDKMFGVLLLVPVLLLGVAFAENKPSIAPVLHSFNQPTSYCLPSEACWPSQKAWAKLAKKVSGRLIKPIPTITPCKASLKSKACIQALQHMKNPLFLQTNPGDTESQGWYGAWKSSASSYAVAAENANDVIAAVNFARMHNIRLVIKGAGHDYLGRSNAPDSLLIWTHNMRQLSYQTDFVAEGAPASSKGQAAITVGAGARWLSVYRVVTGEHHRYVQGGGCASVGAAGGFTQGGGFGSWSKKFGTGAAGVLQFKIVTAAGKLLTVNQYQHPDLFWAVRGGGGGTFGVVTQMTLKTHPLPLHFALIKSDISASNAKAYQVLLQHFMRFFRDKLNNEHWGENITFTPDNHVKIFLLAQGLSQDAIDQVWSQMRTFVNKSPALYKMTFKSFQIPPKKMWDYQFYAKHHPELVTKNTGPNARPGEFWWTPNSGEVSEYWYTYQSRWIPESLFTDKNIVKTAKLFYEASRLQAFGFHIQKGLAGASKAAIKATRKTSTNPSVYKSVGLVIFSLGSNKIFPGVKGHEPDIKKAQQDMRKINKAMQLFVSATPGAGTYANEADYFQKDWEQDFYGSYYAKLLLIKHKYDPSNIFRCHHCVGS